jgi:hypothetical protein
VESPRTTSVLGGGTIRYWQNANAAAAVATDEQAADDHDPNIRQKPWLLDPFPASAFPTLPGNDENSATYRLFRSPSPQAGLESHN